ncbi:MAG: hypothetical protein NZ518_06775, partial [Dehalococcoidia bacterium]|nr:hypothetical protein [Dehalococcoidia bacterium]
ARRAAVEASSPTARSRWRAFWVLRADDDPRRVLALAAWDTLSDALAPQADAAYDWLQRVQPLLDHARSSSMRVRWFTTIREAYNFAVTPTIALVYLSRNDPSASGAFRVWARTAQDRAIRVPGVASCRTLALDNDPAGTLTLAEFADSTALAETQRRMAETPCPVPITDLRRYQGVVWTSAPPATR